MVSCPLTTAGLLGAIAWATGTGLSGWGALVVVLVLSVVVLVAWRWGRRAARPRDERIARSTNRAKLAAARGWQYVAPDAALAARWSAPPRVAGHLLLGGAIAGEVDGLPFTVFETRPPARDLRGYGSRVVSRSVCVLRLPDPYPRIQVREEWRDDAGEVVLGGYISPPLSELDQHELQRALTRPRAEHLVVHAEDPADAERLVTPEVLELTAERGLAGWQLDGHELVLALARDATVRPRSNADVAACVEGLAALARALPPAAPA